MYILTPWRLKELLHPHQIEDIEEFQNLGPEQFRWQVLPFYHRVETIIPQNRLSYNIVFLVTLELIVDLLRSIKLPVWEPSSTEYLPYTNGDVWADEIEKFMPIIRSAALDFDVSYRLKGFSDRLIRQALSYEQVDEDGQAEINPVDLPLIEFLTAAHFCLSEIEGSYKWNREELNTAAFYGVVRHLAQGIQDAFGVTTAPEIMELWWARVQARLPKLG